MLTAAVIGMTALSLSSCKTIEKMRPEDEALINSLNSQIESLQKENNELKDMIKKDRYTLEELKNLR